MEELNTYFFAQWASISGQSENKCIYFCRIMATDANEAWKLTGSIHTPTYVSPLGSYLYIPPQSTKTHVYECLMQTEDNAWFRKEMAYRRAS